MNWQHLSVFAIWTAFVLAAVFVLLFLFTYGDCVDNAACVTNAKRSSSVIMGGGFVIYWLVAITLFRRWNR